MSVTYVIAFQVVPAQRERFLTLLGALLDTMRHEPSFENATLHGDDEDANRFLLHETWRDHAEVMAVQLARPYRQAWHEALPNLLERPRDVGIWQPLRRDSATHWRRDETAPSGAARSSKEP